MKNITKIIIAALLAVSLVAWASPSEAWTGHGRFKNKNQYKHVNKYHVVHKHHVVHTYHHSYPKLRYYHYGSYYKPQYFCYGNCSHLGFYHSSYGTRIHIGFGF